MKPTVGRIVYYVPHSNVAQVGFHAPAAGEPLAALIAAVHHDGTLNLSVSDAEGYPHNRLDVPLFIERNEGPEGGNFAYWMPYQIQQAAKAESASAGQGTGQLAAHNAFLRTDALNGALRTPNVAGHDQVLQAAAAYEQYLTGQIAAAAAAGIDFKHVGEQFPEIAALLAKDFAQGNAFAGIAPEVLATAVALPANAPLGDAPKVEEARIAALMASIDYKTAHLDGTTSTVATARLPGGFVVAVGHSACVSAANFNAEKGRKYAIEDAERKSRHNLWEFEGYALYLRMEQQRADASKVSA